MLHAIPSTMLISASLLLAACQTAPSGPVPAHLVASRTNAACIAQMQQAAGRAGGYPVALTPAAFAAEDLLSIVAADPLDAAGLPRSGRVRGRPDSYRLSLNSGRCVMTHEQGGHSAVLDACTCVAMR